MGFWDRVTHYSKSKRIRSLPVGVEPWGSGSRGAIPVPQPSPAVARDVVPVEGGGTGGRVAGTLRRFGEMVRIQIMQLAVYFQLCKV